jgi:hypothetical protein
MSFFDNYSNAEWVLGELSTARALVVELVPRDIRSILRTEARVVTIHDFVLWDAQVVDALIEVVGLCDPRFKTALGDDRAYCPACGGSLNAYVEGFEFPHELRRHLTGIGTLRRCRVMHHVREVVKYRLFITAKI